MPLPIAHSFAAYSIYRYSKNGEKENLGLIAMLCAAANAPDLDYLPGLLLHKGYFFHHGPTHSLGAALIFGLLIGGGASLLKRASFFKVFALSFAAYASHIILDFFCGGLGVPVFWPLIPENFAFPISLFPMNGHALEAYAGPRLFLSSLIRVETFDRLLYEAILTFSLLKLFYSKEKAPSLQSEEKALGFMGVLLLVVFVSLRA
jgi:membrane-bound metal-dependent hydrolase YbcI (DUF457 family)